MKDEERSKRLKKLKDLDNSMLNQLYCRVFDTDDGQLVLLDLQMRCFKFTPPIGANNDDTNRRIGSQAVITNIESRITPLEVAQPKKKED